MVIKFTISEFHLHYFQQSVSLVSLYKVPFFGLTSRYISFTPPFLVNFQNSFRKTIDKFIRQPIEWNRRKYRRHEPEQMKFWRSNVWWIWLLGKNFPVRPFQVFPDSFCNLWPSVAMQQNQLVVSIVPFQSLMFQITFKTYQVLSTTIISLHTHTNDIFLKRVDTYFHTQCIFV